jgi:hypothetical protein
MAAIKSIEFTLKLDEIDWFAKPYLADTSHEFSHFVFVDHALVRAINSINRYSNSLFHSSALGGIEALRDA